MFFQFKSVASAATYPRVAMTHTGITEQPNRYAHRSVDRNHYEKIL